MLDCANGAGYRVAPTVFSELGAEVRTLGVEPDGKNINEACGSQNTERMASLTKETGADIGIALDGDGDRVIFADEQGRIVDGDAVMAFCGREMIRAGNLPHNTVVATVMSNIGLELALKEVGGKLVRTAVGDRYVVEEMRRADYLLGGEQSGHLVFREYTTTGDGIITALQVLAIMKRTGLKISELAGQMKRLPQVLLNVQVERKAPLEELPGVQEDVAAGRERTRGQRARAGPLLGHRASPAHHDRRPGFTTGSTGMPERLPRRHARNSAERGSGVAGEIEMRTPVLNARDERLYGKGRRYAGRYSRTHS